MTTKTRVNGHEFRIGSGQEHNQTDARRLAAAIERGNPQVVFVRAAIRYDAKVKLDPDSDIQKFDIPDGWAVENVFIGANGAVFLRMNREADDER